MTPDERPVPEPTPETERFWEAASEGTFLLKLCDNCGLRFFYPRAHCPDCFSDSVRWVESDGIGTVYSYSHTKRDPQLQHWPDRFFPIVVAFVELAEGPKVLSRIVDCDPEDVEIGMEVEVEFENWGDSGRVVPVFTPAER